MKRLLGRSASPKTVVVAMVVFLATGCATGQSVPSGAVSPASPVGGPTLTPTVRPSQSDSATRPSASPSSTSMPLPWTEASLKEDWPGPVRPEPAGGAIVVMLQENADEVIPDPLGDAGSAAYPWVDIRELQGGAARIIIELAAGPPLVAPVEQWIAYGVVVDDDRDGIADRRIGMDNIPGGAPGEFGGQRQWITDLHTGTTLTRSNPEGLGASHFEAYYPGSAPYTPTGAMLGFGGECPSGCDKPGLVGPFYVWASVIVDGRVVATDSAPDDGWLQEPDP
jgi:hypothetical protein